MTFKRIMRTVIIPSSFSLIMSSLRSGSSCNSHIKVHAVRMCLVWITTHIVAKRSFYNNWAKQTDTTVGLTLSTPTTAAHRSSSIREDDNVKFKRDYAMEVRQTTFWAKQL
ncbi:hypothetical protein BDB00DRAFT_799087 [Zychaea mexicana]|uniref:uncharacterized protein n=1 Tax=Zychaea mexicana TaxID=64656 RepID=UPI0022FDD7D9|nr:uncharacterized protein BDB00DRAFT_799087 [Zychaea mexicana]KAI9498678.1 hypothetical protein BDB00DRAFT_799087 [Zychaea mexicana]